MTDEQEKQNETDRGKVYMGLDVETTGQYLSHNAMVALGAVVMDEEGATLHTFKVCLAVPPHKDWEPRCVAEFWSNQADLKAAIERDAIAPECAMRGFARWLNLMDLLYGDRLVLLTDNPSFDVAWINLYLAEHTSRPSLYYGYSFLRLATGGGVGAPAISNALELKAQISHSQLNYPENYAAEFALHDASLDDPVTYYEDGEPTLHSNVIEATREEQAFLSHGNGGYYAYRRIWDTDSAFHGAIYVTRGCVLDWGLDDALGVQNDTYVNDHDVLHDAANVVANYLNFLRKFKKFVSVSRENATAHVTGFRESVPRNVKPIANTLASA